MPMQTKSRQKCPTRCPELLAEVHQIKIGWNHFGYVGRFKNAKTWFRAEVAYDGVTPIARWRSDRSPSREMAEQACFNDWLTIRLNKEGATVRRDLQSEIATKEARIIELEDAKTAIALDDIKAEDLADALVGRLSGDKGRIYGDTIEHCCEALEPYLKHVYIDALDENAIKELARENDIALVEDIPETDGVRYHREAAHLADKIGDEWRGARNFPAIIPLLDRLGSVIRYDCGGSGELFD